MSGVSFECLGDRFDDVDDRGVFDTDADAPEDGTASLEPGGAEEGTVGSACHAGWILLPRTEEDGDADDDDDVRIERSTTAAVVTAYLPFGVEVGEGLSLEERVRGGSDVATPQHVLEDMQPMMSVRKEDVRHRECEVDE